MAKHPRCSKTPSNRLQSRRFEALRHLQNHPIPARPALQARSARAASRPPDRLQPSRTGPAARFAPAVAALAAAACLLWALQVRPVPDAPDAGTLAPPAPAAGVMTDASTEGDVWAGIPVPPQPGPGQETQCDPASAEVSINGACYVQTSSEPPCPGKQYEHGGKCWIAVGKRKPAGRAIGQ